MRVCAFIADYGYCVASFVRGATTFGYTGAETERAANNQKEIRGITVGRLATGQYGSEY